MNGILSLDQSTTVGWAYARPGETPRWGHVRLGEPGEDNGVIANRFWRRLSAWNSECQPMHLVFEAPYIPSSSAKSRVPDNAQTMRRLLGLAWEIELFAEVNGLDCMEVSSVSATKFMTGKGRFPDRRSKKRAVIQACHARGWKCQEDEADALALLLFAESELYPKEAYTRPRTYRVPTGPLLTA